MANAVLSDAPKTALSLLNQDWYPSMLELETKVYSIDVCKKVAFFDHIIFIKN